MVLQEITNSDEPTMQDAPLSDLDPYSSEPARETVDIEKGPDGRPIYNYRIDTTKLPRPWGPFGPRPIDQHMLEGLSQQLGFATNILNRRLKQDELDALSYHFARGMRIASFGIPLGIAGGTLYALRNRSTYAFPFYTPKEGFNPDKFGPFRGRLAQNLWHAVRCNCYGFVGVILGGVFFSSLAVSLDAAGKASDPRLKDFSSALRQRMKEGRSMEPMNPRTGQKSSVTTQEGGMQSQVLKAEEALNRSRARNANPPSPRMQRSSRRDDDMSPTSGSWVDENVNASSDTGLLSDAQIRSQESRQQADERTSATENRANTFDLNKVTRQPRSFDQDDASPAASNAAASKPQSGGNTWERIRKEAVAGPKSPANSSWNRPKSVQGEQREGSTLGDSFSFSETDEERQLAQSEAQRDFDARLEKERQGGEFDQGSRGKRW